MVSLLIATPICKSGRRSVLRHVLWLAAAAIVASVAVAQDAGASKNRKASGTSGRQKALPSNDLPDAAEILDGYVEATGGKKTYEKLKTRIARGTLDIAALGTKGKVQTWQQSPDKLYSVTEVGEFGKTERAFDGKNAWEIAPPSPLAGLLGDEDKSPKARLLEGAEKAYMLREATFNSDLRWREVIEKAETVGEELIADQPAWKLQLATKDGQTLTHYYDKYTKLLVRVDASVITEAGEVPVEVYPSDYRKTKAGVSVPFRSTQKMMGISQTVTFESIEFNVPIEKTRFDPPEPVRKLLASGKQGKPEPPRKGGGK